MPEKPSRSTSGTTANQVLVGFATLAFLYFTGEVLKPLALSVLLAFALTPVSSRLERLRLPRAMAVVLTLLIVLGVIGGIGSVVARQVSALAAGLPSYRGNIESKLSAVFDARAVATSDRLSEMVNEVTAKLDKPKAGDQDRPATIQNVRVVQEPSFQERLRASIGPYLESLGVFSFVLVLVLFMLLARENLRDRIVALFGHRHVGLTTRTMEEIGGRISRYLVTVALVNSGFGLVIGLGLALIGVPFAVLWGCLAALLRFIPYVGVAATFGLTTVFAAAHFTGWGQAVAVVVTFGVVETILSSFLEPVIFGKTTGLSALGLLIAAMFWTWLWGTLGLLLSTPMTVCLAVIGKYVPGLSFFSTLLGEETELAPHLRFYQRIVALDRKGAIGVVEDELKTRPPVAVFDDVLVPALARAAHDAARGMLDEAEQTLVWDVTGSILDEIERSPSPGPDEGPAGEIGPGEATPRLAGLPLDQGDALVLRMVRFCLQCSGVELEVLPEGESPLQLRETLSKLEPTLVLISYLPSGELASVRYLMRRLRVQGTGPPIVVGLWKRGPTTSAHRLMDEGALYVVSSVAEARDRIVRTLFPAEASRPEAAPLPA
jgi:predicted PurR-regulated permease PerM